MSSAPLTRRRSAAVLLLWLAAVLLAALQIARSTFTADLTAFLPASPDAQQRVLIEQLKSGLPSRTLLMGISGGDGVARAKVSHALATALHDSGLFETVSNGETTAWADVGSWLFKRRYALSPAVDAERFTADGLRDAIADSLSLLGTPAGNAIKPLLDRDPTGETQRIAETLIPASAPRTEQGVWTSRQGGRALLLATTRAPGADLDAQALAMAQVRGAFAAAAAASGATPGLTLQMSGAPVFSVDSRARIELEVRWLAIAGTVLMSSLLLLAFASPVALVVAMLPVASGVLAGIAAVSLSFGTVHGITLGFGSTLIGEAVDYAIYYLIQARGHAGQAGQAGHGAGWRHWLNTGWPTVRLGLLTSVCGFTALVFSGFPGLAQLGVFSVAGLVAAALATRFVLPVLMPDGARGVGLRRQLGRVARRAVVWLPRLKLPLLVLGVASLVLIWQRSDLWKAELSSLSPVSKAALDLDASLRADLTSTDAGALVVVQGPDAEQTLQRAEAAAARLEPLVEQRVLAGYDSVTRLLPSVATQRQRLASLPGTAALQTALEEATRGGPLPAARLAPFVAEVEQARQRAPDTPASVRGTAVSPLVDAMLLQRDNGSWAALLPLQPGRSGLDTAAVTAALQGLPGTQLLDIGSELGRLYKRYLGEAETQALLGALGVVVLMALWLRNTRRVLAVCQPLLLAVVLTLGGLALFHVSLGILHLVGLLLVVAVGSNYALFFDMLRDRHSVGDTDDDTLASLLLANLTTVLSFALIAMSQIPALSAIGRVVAPGALLALVLAAAFAPRPARVL
jgi:predicted exporter